MASVITPAICTSEFEILRTAVDSWQNDNSKELLVNVGGFPTKGVSSELERSIERFLDATANAGKQVEPDAKETLMAIDYFATAYVDFKRLSAEGSPEAPPNGSMDLWRQFGNLLEHFKSRPYFPKPQPIAMLIDQGVGFAQIASIYGWLKADGRPDLEMIREERDKPGTHYNRDTWQHPGKVNRQRIIDAEWRQHGLNRSAIFGRSAARDDQAAKVETNSEPTKFVPPSLAEMVRVRAPARQIANVHGISVDQAEQMLLDAEASKAKSALLQEV